MVNSTLPSIDDGHADPTLSLYVLGVLQDRERVEFEAHLLGCPACLTECDRLGSLVSTMSELDPADLLPAPQPVAVPVPLDALAEALAPIAPPTPTAAPASVPTQRPSSTPVPEPAAPVPGRAHRVNPARRRAWTRPQLAVLSLGLVVALGLGAVGGFLAGRGQSGGPTDVSLVAVSDGGGASNPSLSVFVLNRREGVTVHATVLRLEPGVRYTLLAVTAEGRTLIVTEWWGQDGALDISGDLDVPATALAFFSVVRADGTQVMQARVQR